MTNAVPTAADFIFEIGTEELPPRDLSAALDQLRHLVPDLLQENRLKYDGFIHIGGTPRRLVVYIETLSPNQADEERLIKGPPADIAFDAQGQPTQAATGFAHNYSASVDELTITEINGKRFVALKRVEKGWPTPQVLSKVLPKLISNLKFPLTMRWNETGITFPRPIRWLLALHGDALIGVEYAGVPSDRYTYGIRSESSPEIAIPRAEDYRRIIAKHGIILNFDERRQSVWEQITVLADQVGGAVPEDPELLEEVANLVENPTALLGHFNPNYLSLPEDVLITVMKKHQRYFPIRREANNSLTAYFVTVANGDKFDRQAVLRGNEDVIRARFEDASFFYKNDTAKALADFVPKLTGLTFHDELGSYLDKTERLQRLVSVLAERLALSTKDKALALRTAELCKADLVTEMVIEFTSLQGRMGREYALNSEEDPRVAEAILEHYLPRFAGDVMPKTWLGIIVGLADRLDNLVGLFSVGLSPTGAADPYGLRRAAIGIVQVLIDREVPLTISQAVYDAANLLPRQASEETLSDAINFIQRRLEGWLLERGFRPDLSDAVLSERRDNPALAYKTVMALHDWVERPEFDQLLVAYTRVANIVRPFKDCFPLKPDYLVEPATQQLYQAYLAAQKPLEPSMEVDELLTAMLPLVEPINTFFDDILVIHEDTTLKQARLGLLQRVAELPKGVVDLTAIKV